MTPETTERMKMKLVRTVLHLNKTEQQKKDESAVFNEIIKTAKEKIELLAQAINNGTTDLLLQRFPEELDGH